MRFSFFFITTIFICSILLPFIRLTPVDIKVDIVISLEYAASHSLFHMFKREIKKLPQYFSFGPDKARAAVGLVGDPVSITQLTDDPDQYVRDVDSLKRVIGSNPNTGILLNLHTLMNNTIVQTFTDLRSSKVFIFITSEGISFAYETMVEANRLRNKTGVWIYILSSADKADPNSLQNKQFASFTGNPDQFFVMPNVNKDIPVILENISLDVVKKIKICTFTRMCEYEDSARQQCRAQWWRPFMTNDAVNSCAGHHQPSNAPTPLCQLDECQKMCDENWPWNSSKSCASACGILVRVPTTPSHDLLKNCLREMNCTYACGHGTGQHTSTIDSTDATENNGGLYLKLSPNCLVIVIMIIGAEIGLQLELQQRK